MVQLMHTFRDGNPKSDPGCKYPQVLHHVWGRRLTHESGVQAGKVQSAVDKRRGGCPPPNRGLPWTRSRHILRVSLKSRLRPVLLFTPPLALAGRFSGNAATCGSSEPSNCIDTLTWTRPFLARGSFL